MSELEGTNLRDRDHLAAQRKLKPREVGTCLNCHDSKPGAESELESRSPDPQARGSPRSPPQPPCRPSGSLSHRHRRYQGPVSASMRVLLKGALPRSGRWEEGHSLDREVLERFSWLWDSSGVASSAAKREPKTRSEQSATRLLGQPGTFHPEIKIREAKAEPIRRRQSCAAGAGPRPSGSRWDLWGWRIPAGPPRPWALSTDSRPGKQHCEPWYRPPLRGKGVGVRVRGFCVSLVDSVQTLPQPLSAVVWWDPGCLSGAGESGATESQTLGTGQVGGWRRGELNSGSGGE